MTSMERYKRRLARGTVALFSVAGSLAATEIFLRVNEVRVDGTPPAIRYVNINDVIAHEPGATFTLPNEVNERMQVSIDARGFRNSRLEPLDPGTVLLLGDSFIAGFYTKEEATVAGQLRTAGFRVINAGVNGIGTVTETAIFERRFSEGRGLRVVLLFFLGNDFKDNYWSDPLPVQREGWVKVRTLLSEWFAGCSWAKVCGLARNMTTISGYALDPMGSFPQAELRMLGAPSSHQQRAIDVTRSSLETLASLARTRESSLLVVGVPSKAQSLRSFYEVVDFSLDRGANSLAQQLLWDGFSWDKPDSLLADLCRELELPYVSLLERFRMANAQEPLYLHFDQHWNSAGQLIAAETISAALRDGRRP